MTSDAVIVTLSNDDSICCHYRSAIDPAGQSPGQGTDPSDAHWLVAVDRDGLEPRERLAVIISERFGLDQRDQAGLLAELRGGLVRQIIPDPRSPGRCAMPARPGGSRSW